MPPQELTLESLQMVLPAQVMTERFEAVPVRFVEPRLLRRLVRSLMRGGPIWGDVPHRHGLVVDRMLLAAETSPREVGYPELQWVDVPSVPRKMILLVAPGNEQIRRQSPRQILTHCWRLLFHARLHLILEERSEDSDATGNEWVFRWLTKLGPTTMEEAAVVLEEDGFLLFPRRKESVLYELIVRGAELLYFDPDLLPVCFPSLNVADDLRRMIAEVFGDRREMERLLQESKPDIPSVLPEPLPRSPVIPDEAIPGEGYWDFLERQFRTLSDRKGYLSQRHLQRAKARHGRLVRCAKASLEERNPFRAVMLYAKAERLPVPREMRQEARSAIAKEIERLTRRLHMVVRRSETTETAESRKEREGTDTEFDQAERLLRESLRLSVGKAVTGFWTAEARILHHLWRIGLDAETPLRQTGVLRWICSAGRRPLWRKQPLRRIVSVTKHIGSVERLLPRIRIDPTGRRCLEDWVRRSTMVLEERTRNRFRPLLTDALSCGGIVANGLCEKVASEKIVEELLDEIVEHGTLSFAGLRDAISRSVLKLPDLRLRELYQGDALLRTDRRLSESLDGVYRPGEFYLRWMQKIVSVAFGNRIGRGVMRYVGLPFGGAAILLSFSDYVAGHILHYYSDPVVTTEVDSKDAAASETGRTEATEEKTIGTGLVGSEDSKEWTANQMASQTANQTANQAASQTPNQTGALAVISESNSEGFVATVGVPEPLERSTSTTTSGHSSDPAIFFTWQMVLLLGMFLVFVVNSKQFRRSLKRLCVQTGEWIRRGRAALTGALRGPLTAGNTPPRPQPFRSVFRQAMLPLMVTGALWPIWAPGQTGEKRLLYGAVVFLITVIALNSRAWRMAEEFLFDRGGRIWRAYGLRFILLFGSWIADLFRTGMAAIERFLYVVDEQLRVHRSQSRMGVVVRVIVVTLWSGVSYFIRFAVSLFIEPQINPLKHFPVVTVSHKFLLPTIPFVGSLLTPMIGSHAEALMVATVIITSIPGMFGFLVWELKEGWRLYAANRSPDLQPVLVGGHGETIAGLLRRGFHSGTIPRGFRRLRKAERTLRQTGNRTPLRRQLQAFEHVEQMLRSFFQRELAALICHEAMVRHESLMRSGIDRMDVAETLRCIEPSQTRGCTGASKRRTAPEDASGELAEWIRIGKIVLRPTLVTVELLRKVSPERAGNEDRNESEDSSNVRVDGEYGKDGVNSEYRPLCTLWLEVRQRFLLADLVGVASGGAEPRSDFCGTSVGLAELSVALYGVYRKAGVDLVGEQIRKSLESRETWCLEEKRLVVRRALDESELGMVGEKGASTENTSLDAVDSVAKISIVKESDVADSVATCSAAKNSVVTGTATRRSDVVVAGWKNLDARETNGISQRHQNLRVYRLDSPTEAILPGEYASPDIPVRGPALRRSELIFTETPLPWSLWIRCWGDPDEAQARRQLAAIFDFDPCECRDD